MEDIEKEISFIEQKLAQLKEQIYQALTPLKHPDKERKGRHSGVGKSRVSGDLGQLQAKSPTHEQHEESKRNENEPYQSLHASPDKADEQRDKDVYGSDRAIARNNCDPEHTANLNYIYQTTLCSLRDLASDDGRMREIMRFRMV